MNNLIEDKREIMKMRRVLDEKINRKHKPIYTIAFAATVRNAAKMMYKEKRGNILVPGLQTTAKTRPLIIDALYSIITEFPEIIKSQRLVLELIGLISKPSGRVEADVGCHDDLALSAGLCFYVHKYDPVLMLQNNAVVSSLFTEVMGLNDYGSETINDANIMRHVKDHISENKGMINTMEFFFGADRG